MNTDNVEVLGNIGRYFDKIKFLGFTVIRMKQTQFNKNNFINGTKLCKDISKKIGKKKQIEDWIKLDRTLELINYVKNKNLLEGNFDDNTKIYYTVKGGSDKEIRGKYIHIDLVTDLCSWLSPEITFKVANIVNYINGFEKQNDEITKLIENEKNKEEIKKNNEDEKLKETENNNENNNNKINNNEINNKIKKPKTKLDIIKQQVNKTLKENKDLIKTVNELKEIILEIKKDNEEYKKQILQLLNNQNEILNILKNNNKEINN
jgi:hypothetical protein